MGNKFAVVSGKNQPHRWLLCASVTEREQRVIDTTTKSFSAHAGGGSHRVERMIYGNGFYK